MKKNKTKKWIVCGIICVLIAAISTWYSILFNDSRLVAPMNFKGFTISLKDLPMIVSIFLVCVYVIALFGKLCVAVRKKQKLSPISRKVNPKLEFSYQSFCCIVMIMMTIPMKARNNNGRF